MSRRPKTLKAAKKRAWTAVSAYIRQRHSNRGLARCVTCNAVHRWADMDAGHFQHGLTYGVSDDGSPFVWEENIWVQCRKCNRFASGMLDKYTLHMIDYYGREFVEELQAARFKPVKLRIDDYWMLEQEYNNKARELAA